MSAVGCRCGWRGEDAELIRVPRTQGPRCPKCDAAFREAPPLRVQQEKPRLIRAIASEIYGALERLGADEELLSIIGSIDDTLSDEEILRLLRNYNKTGKVIRQSNDRPQ